MGWPEWAMLVLLAAGIAWPALNKRWDEACINTVSASIVTGLLYAVGFFS